MENYYTIVYEGRYGDWYSFIRKKDVVELAKYLNDRVLRNRNDIVKAVYLGDKYLDANEIVNVSRMFFPMEYHDQYFLESYEARLLEKYHMEKLAL